MRYFFATLLPPLAVLKCHRPYQTLLNTLLTLAFFLPGVIHAWVIVHQDLVSHRNEHHPQLGRPNPFG